LPTGATCGAKPRTDQDSGTRRKPRRTA
jgi:hypothetical protein